MNRCLVWTLLRSGLVLGVLVPGVLAQSAPDPELSPDAVSARSEASSAPLCCRADIATVTSYVWRGQRLTNGWSLQPSGTLSLGDFALNVWGTLDLTAVNEGDALYLPQNPAAAPGSHAGLQGKFSEVDYTFSYTKTVGEGSLQGGAILYTFPERSASIRSTTELYGGVTFDWLLAPSATLYVDVDETREGAGETGVYLKLGVFRSIPIRHRILPSIDLSSSLGFASRGFGEYYYAAPEAGVHDFNLTATFPVRFGERWSASAFLAYSTLLGGFRQLQYMDRRDVYAGHHEPAQAGTIHGGAVLSLVF